MEVFSRRGFEGAIDMGFADLPAPDTPLFVLLVRLDVLGQDCRSRVGNATFGHILRIFFVRGLRRRGAGPVMHSHRASA